jgi:hypothetical protein
MVVLASEGLWIVGFRGIENRSYVQEEHQCCCTKVDACPGIGLGLCGSERGSPRGLGSSFLEDVSSPNETSVSVFAAAEQQLTAFLPFPSFPSRYKPRTMTRLTKPSLSPPARVGPDEAFGNPGSRRGFSGSPPGSRQAASLLWTPGSRSPAFACQTPWWFCARSMNLASMSGFLCPGRLLASPHAYSPFLRPP